MANEFDVFLCHNSKDKPTVRRLATLLSERGVRPWLDEDELRPGVPWQAEVGTSWTRRDARSMTNTV